MWTTAEPIVSEWVKRKVGPEASSRTPFRLAMSFCSPRKKLPDLLERYERMLALSEQHRDKTPFFMQRWFAVLSVGLMLLLGAAALNSLF